MRGQCNTHHSPRHVHERTRLNLVWSQQIAGSTLREQWAKAWDALTIRDLLRESGS
jgi:hypothetical protein